MAAKINGRGSAADRKGELVKIRRKVSVLSQYSIQHGLANKKNVLRPQPRNPIFEPKPAVFLKSLFYVLSRILHGTYMMFLIPAVSYL